MTQEMTSNAADEIFSRSPDVPMLVGGERVGAVDGRWIEVTAPSRAGQVLGRVPRAGAADVDRAVEAAQAAFPAWRALHFTERQ